MNSRSLQAGLLAAAAFVTGPALAANVGVSVSIGQPGFFGRIDIGGAPRPELVYAQPVIYQPAPVAVVRQPIYLRVPPGHEKNWGRYCGQYAACGQPVYFVKDSWYRDVYAPHYRRTVVVNRPVVVHRPVVVVKPPVLVHRDGRHDDRHDGRHDNRGDNRGQGRGHDKDRGRD